MPEHRADRDDRLDPEPEGEGQSGGRRRPPLPSREGLTTTLALGVPALAAAVAIFVLAGSDDGAEAPDPQPAPTAEVAAVSGGADAAARGARRGERAELTRPGDERIGGPRPAPPQSLAIPSLGIDTPLVATDSNSKGIVIPPPDEAGWLSTGPRPGEPGRSVFVGHLDSTDGPAIFYEIGQAQPGDPVFVADADGEALEYEITGVSQVAKESFPAEAVYEPTTKSTLVLITCGGEFDSRTGSYEDNVIAYAKLASDEGERDRRAVAKQTRKRSDGRASSGDGRRGAERVKPKSRSQRAKGQRSRRSAGARGRGERKDRPEGARAGRRDGRGARGGRRASGAGGGGQRPKAARQRQRGSGRG